MVIFFVILGAVLLLFSIIALVGAYVVYKIVFRKDEPFADDPFSTLDKFPEYEEKRRELVTDAVGRPYEEVSVFSCDGLELFGRYYHFKDGATLEIKAHGYRSISVRDYSAAPMESERAERNLLLIDQRAHGKSEGCVISFGAKEKHDVLSWIEWARERFGTEVNIILSGISMGGATVLLASELSLPDNVKGIIADCPYSDATEQITLVGKRSGVPKFVSAPLLRLGALIYGRFRLSEASPQKAVAKASVPILLLHGEADRFVPCYMSRNITERGPTVALYTFEGAQHGFSYLTDPEKYRELCEQFIHFCLGK